MAEYSPDDFGRATHIVERLFNRESDGLDLGENLVVSDVEFNARTFADELSLLEQLNADVPGVVIRGEKVPISLEVYLGWFGRSAGILVPGFFDRSHPIFSDFIYEAMRRSRRKSLFPEANFLNRKEARSTFLRRAADFVATRIAGIRGYRKDKPLDALASPSLLSIRQLLGGRQVQTPGCNFTVSTNSSGLRVFWSGAYYVTPNYFNHPTTPTSSVLQSGTYIFGVAPRGGQGRVAPWRALSPRGLHRHQPIA